MGRKNEKKSLWKYVDVSGKENTLLSSENCSRVKSSFEEKNAKGIDSTAQADDLMESQERAGAVGKHWNL